VAATSGRLGGRYGSARFGAAGGIVFALASLWFLTILGDQPHYLTHYLPGTVVGGLGVGLILPAITSLAASTLPPARLATGIGVQTTFRQIGAALGLASFVAIVGSSTLTAKSDFDGSWLFMTVASASAGIVLTPLIRHRPQAAVLAASGEAAARAN
jgi:MFS family permease